MCVLANEISACTVPKMVPRSQAQTLSSRRRLGERIGPWNQPALRRRNCYNFCRSYSKHLISAPTYWTLICGRFCKSYYYLTQPSQCPWGALSGLKFFFFFFCLLRAAPEACGRSQARGGIGAVATSLHHNHSNQHRFQAASATSRQRRILNPLSEARDQTCILMVPNWVH